MLTSQPKPNISISDTKKSDAPATSPNRQPTSFFSLPLELRQMIYDTCIPATYGILIITDWHEQTVLALQASHPLIASEVRERDKRQFSLLRIVVAPRSAFIPALLVPQPPFARIEEVDFVFDTIDPCKGVHCDHIRNALVHRQITSMITTTRNNTDARLWNQNFMIDFRGAVVHWLEGRLDKAQDFYLYFLVQWIWTRPGVQYMLPESWYHDRLRMKKEQALRYVEDYTQRYDRDELGL
ncbi:uncharacterized protein MYCFIDRAFT_77856 [Pseudocercospora fijiensis CIRAD86]|uniref:Uncharacterized protein n=1 Tax=Pseudocercospora fijiensis (strain CIRAD86) TaxID=383855 RepID=M3ARL0_PSEFD|nr:uncharacterized protein MYCFIDRAFT_77856 [Pseudocercospora fijiensis CIRAD86]EME80072.1 hypothetical protein MYCFIDRAFT_77856 [Pseudocercospora fijiensis CIRAD86]